MYDARTHGTNIMKHIRFLSEVSEVHLRLYNRQVYKNTCRDWDFEIILRACVHSSSRSRETELNFVFARHLKGTSERACFECVRTENV